MLLHCPINVTLKGVSVAHQLAFPVTKVIKENLSVVMMFAYSQPPLREFRRGNFAGNWPYVDEVLFTIPEQLATRALIELVLLFRTLDDQEDIDDGSLGATFGKLDLKNGNVQPLTIREVANKTIHAKKIEWVFADPERPILKTTAYDNAREKWAHAEIDINTFAVGCGMLTG
jgi:hypothetical protein